VAKVIGMAELAGAVSNGECMLVSSNGAGWVPRLHSTAN
jgi:hypothetical protein